MQFCTSLILTETLRGGTTFVYQYYAFCAAIILEKMPGGRDGHLEQWGINLF